MAMDRDQLLTNLDGKLDRFEKEATKLRAIAKSAQASSLVAVQMARGRNWRATIALIISVGAMLVAVVSAIIAFVALPY